MSRRENGERRSAERVDARLPIQVTEPDSTLVVTSESLNVSRGGICCRTTEYVAPLAKVAMTIILPPFGNLSRASRIVKAGGVVVRCEAAPEDEREQVEVPEYDLACCFTDVEGDARNLLDAFVAWRLLRTARAGEELVPRGGDRRVGSGGGRRAGGGRNAGHRATTRTGGSRKRASARSGAAGRARSKSAAKKSKGKGRRPTTGRTRRS